MSPEIQYVLAGVVLLGAFALVYKFPLLSIPLYISIYIFKPMARFQMPFLIGYVYDMFALAVAFYGALVLWIKDEPGGIRVPIFPLIAMGTTTLALLIGLNYTRAPEYGMKKLLIFGVFDVLSLLLPTLMIRNHRLARGVVRWFVIFGSAVFVMLLISDSSVKGYGSRYTLLDANPLAPAEMMNNALLALIVLLLLRPRPMVTIVSLVALPALVYGVASTGARGSLVATALVTLALLGLYASRRIFFYSIVGACVACALFLILNQGLSDKTKERFGEKDISVSMEARVSRTIDSLRRVWTCPTPLWGNGPADSAYEILGREGKSYPHSVLIEVFDEAGVPAGSLFAGMLVYILLSGSRTVRGYERGSTEHWIAVTFLALFASKLIETFKTGSYAGSNMFYFLAGCNLAIYHIWRHERGLKEQRAGGFLVGGCSAAKRHGSALYWHRPSPGKKSWIWYRREQNAVSITSGLNQGS